ncbi:MAG: dGTP triphosphohydrolase [Terriglobales bacterium]
MVPCAFREESSRGRRVFEAPHPYRGEFQRDRDRIIHSRAFRRLENKTQVFTRRFSDHFRTRLTHTLEVAQISRTVAQALGLNSELVETLALAHDIGHPPFGHSGEKALNAVMAGFGERFDHNLHALRIVEQFEIRYAAFPGLNLSFEVREGIVKHSRDYGPHELPEIEEYLPALKPPAEAQLIDLTDEIGYGAADLDDAFEAHLLSLPQLDAELPVFSRALREFDGGNANVAPKLRFNESLKHVMDELITDLIETTAGQLLDLDSSDSVRLLPERVVGFSPIIESDRRALKEFLYREVYDHPKLRAEKAEGEEVVQDVFARLLGDPGRLPPSYQAKIPSAPAHRVICDYIAGMTDSYILDLQQHLHEKPRHRPAL